MAKLAKVTLTFRDDFGRKQSNEYQWRLETPPADSDVEALATDAQALTALSLDEAQVTYSVDVSGQSDTVVTGASRQNDWSMEVNKSKLRNSRGGTYTFRKLPQPKAALIIGNTKQVDSENAALNSFLENFDDGAGLAAIVGDWYISDGEEVVEGTGGDQIVAAYLNKD